MALSSYKGADVKADSFTAKFSVGGVTLSSQQGLPEKTISHTDFLSGYQRAFSKKIKEEQAVSDGAIRRFPRSLISMVEDQNSMVCVLYYPARIMPKVKYHDKYESKNNLEIENVPLPNVLIRVFLKKVKDRNDISIKWKLDGTGVYFYATDRSPLSVPDGFLKGRENAPHIWTLPMPNIYSEGRMCYGGNSVISTFTDNLTTLDYYYRMLEESPFNNDLSIPCCTRTSNALSWMKYLSGKEEFPYKDLTSFNQNMHDEHTSFFQII